MSRPSPVRYVSRTLPRYRRPRSSKWVSTRQWSRWAWMSASGIGMGGAIGLIARYRARSAVRSTLGCRRAPADDQFGDDCLLQPVGGPGLHASEDALGSGLPDPVHLLVDRREVEVAAQLQVVVADDGHVRGHIETGIAEGRPCAVRLHVRRGTDRCHR